MDALAATTETDGRPAVSTKGHGRHKFWLWPLYEKENIEAGCHQCHAREIVTDQAETLNAGRALFFNKGCWGCHRFEGFDKEAEELAAVQQQIMTLGKEQGRESQRDATLDRAG